LNEESAGRYECTASVPDNADIWARASVFLRGPPKIFSDGKDQTAPLDSTGKVTCEALSVPPVERVEWFYRDLPVFSGVYAEDLHYSVIENRTQDGVVSTLIIAKVSNQDFGEYTCRVSNSLGSDVSLIKLTKERKCEQFLSFIIPRPSLSLSQSVSFFHTYPLTFTHILVFLSHTHI
jgi:hypothetical protein